MALEKRVRSPNYPALSLPDALERVQMIYRNQHTHAAPREVVVKSMGYTGINGASATAISALHKYGLLERAGDEVKISDRAMRYLHPNDPDERPTAIREAALEPVLFQELAEKFPGRLPNEEVLRNYLIRNGFSPGAVSGVILAYRETMDLVDREGGGHEPAQSQAPSESHHVLSAQPINTSPPVIGSPILSQNQTNERSLGRHDFDDGSYVRIVTSGDLDTDEALMWVEILIATKRKELELRTRKATIAAKERQNLGIEDE